MTIYHNPRCAKSRETLKLIKDAGKDVEVREYLKTPPTADELRDVLLKLNLPVEYLIRKNEDLYKTNFKGKEFSEALVKLSKRAQRLDKAKRADIEIR